MSEKTKEPKLKDIIVVRNFPKVFPDDLSGLPPSQEFEFHISLIPGAMPIAKSLYRLAPSEMEELTKEEHEMHLGLILKLLKKEKLYAKFSKCELWLQEVQFIRHVINGNGIHVDPSKIKAVKNWEAPRTLSKVCSFLGLAGYYRRFIKNFSRIAKPLTILTQKNKPYVWVNEALGTRLDMSTAYHLQTDGQSERIIQTLKDMLRACIMDFRGSTLWERVSYTILWAEVGEGQLTGPEIVQETTKMISQIKDRLKVAQDRVVRFGKKGKLAPRFVGPFEITKRVGPIAYRLRLPEELNGVHDTFHVSNLKKFLADQSLHMSFEEIQVDAKLNFAKELVEILQRKFKKLKRSRIPIVKILARIPTLTNEDIRNSAAYKEYYAIASGAAPPKTKASVRKTQSSSNTTITPPTAAGKRLLSSAKGKQHAKSSNAKGLSMLSEVAMTEAEQMKLATKRSLQQTHISQASGSGGFSMYQLMKDENEQDLNNDGDDFVHPKLSTHDDEAKDEESFDPIVQTPSQAEKCDNESNDDESHDMNVGGEEGPDAEYDDKELYRDVNINLEGRDVQMTDVHTTQVLEDTHVTQTLVNHDSQQQSSSMSSQFVTSMLNPSPDAGIDSIFESTPWVDVQVTTTVAPLPLTTPTHPTPSIPTISQVQQAPAPTPATSTLQDLLNFSSLFGFYHHLKNLEANFSDFVYSMTGFEMKLKPKMKIFSTNLMRIFKDYKVTSKGISYAMAVDLSELELKKILIEKMERNKSIHRSYEQRNLYKALVDAYECDKIILDTYRDTVTLKRRRDDADKDEEPFAGSDRGSKRRREGKKPESTGAPKEKASETTDKSSEGYKSHQKTASKSAPAEEPIQTTQDLEEPSHQEFETGAADDQPVAEASQHLEWFQKQKKPPDHFSAFLMNRLNVDTLTPELLAGPTYEMMKGSCKSLVELKFFLEEGRKCQQFYGFAVNRESARDVYSKRRIIDVTELQIVEWHNYKHLDCITVGRDDDKLYNYKRIHIQDIEDMLLLLVQGKLTNLTFKECFAFNVSLRMFTRSIVIQRHVEDLQLGVKSYQKKLNLTKPDTYRSDLKCKKAYTAYSNPRGFIY
nr:hypothetical protein [Tanacetum cinerariifolium]